MATIETRYGQKISLEEKDGYYVLTLQHNDGEVLAQIGMEPHEFFYLYDEVVY